MRDFKILLVLIAFVGVTYWGVEPYAHHVMHPTLPAADFTFGVKPANIKEGNVSEGQALVAAQCATCHSVKKADINLSMSPEDAANAYGVLPPDLSNAAGVYDSNYLVAFLQDPAKVSMAPKTAMPNLGLTDKQATDIVAYLSSIADHNLTGKQVTEASCGYCHTVKYDGVTRVVSEKRIKEYLGKNPPDLSMMIKSRGEHYLESFINNPQNGLPGTAMPRVGLSQESQEKVIAYLDQVGDPKKAERNALGFWVIGYFVILTVLTFMWKTAKLREVH
jgi:ubiquinol-cytochrome c reductase cytochrome c1 subunit